MTFFDAATADLWEKLRVDGGRGLIRVRRA